MLHGSSPVLRSPTDLTHLDLAPARPLRRGLRLFMGPQNNRLAIAVLACALLTSVAQAGSSNSLLDISADGRFLAAVNRDNGTVTIVDLETQTPIHEIKVGKKPEAATFLGKTHRLAVTVYGNDEVAWLDAETGKKTGVTEVFDEPYGIVSNADGTRVYVTLEYPGQVLVLNTEDRQLLQTWTPGSFLRGIALTADEQRIYVTEYLTGTLLALDAKTGEEVDRWAGQSSDNLARQVALHPTRAKAYVPHIRSRVRINQGEGSVVPFVSVMDTRPGEGRRRTPVPMDSFYSVFVVANPWETAISPDGRTFCAVFAGTDDMYVCDVIDDDYEEIAFRRVIRLGHNPRAVRFSPDGSRFYVYNTLDFDVVAYNTDTLQKVGKITVCKNPLGDEVLQGKILFYTALQPMVGRRWISCSSCHPDGDADGRTWQNPEGLRNTTALYGMAWTHPIHWSADRDEVQDFEHTIRSQLMQGQGLIRGRVQPSLGGANKGLSADLDALSAYSNSHAAPLSPHAKEGLSESAERGKVLFFSKETRCAECHHGPYFCDASPKPPFRLHDVGTGLADKTEKMGPKYDTPTLLNLYRTAPYLHDGQAATLLDVLTTCNPEDKHGRTSHLKKAQLDDLVEYLKSLPYEDSEGAAAAAGLTKIDR